MMHTSQSKKPQASRGFVSSLDRHFITSSALLAAGVAGVATLATTESAQAAVVYSGTQNLSITPDFNGIYVNMVNNLTGTSGTTTPGWDMNIWVIGATTTTPSWALFANGNGALADGGTLVTSGTDAMELNEGDPVGPAGAYSTSSAVVPASGTNFYGIRLLNETSGQIHYGWFRATLPQLSGPPAGPAGTLVDWAFEDQAGVAIAAGAGIPEPASLGLLAVGALGLLKRRNRA